MTVILATATDSGFQGVRWEVPQDNALDHSPIPRGVRTYTGTLAVLALGANDETNVRVEFTFPSAFNYLIKSLTVQFRSDDVTTEFSNFGLLDYFPGDVKTPGIRFEYPLVCEGAAFRDAVNSIQVYHPIGTSWRRWVSGPDGDTMRVNLADISNDASTAGDCDWSLEFWEYNINQCLQWPVNTPAPTLSY